MTDIYSVLSNETLEKIAAGGDLYESMTDDELAKVAEIENQSGAISNMQPVTDDYWNTQDQVETPLQPTNIIGNIGQPLITADEAKGMPSMGASTKAALRVQKQGGPVAYGDDGSIVNWLGNLWNAISYNSSGKVTAKSTNKHTQSILRGTIKKNGKEVALTQLDDDELDYLVDSAGWNGWKGWLGSFVGNRADDGIMQQWDRTIGATIKDPVARKKARVEYAQDIARMMVEQQESEKQAADIELENRPKHFGADVGAGFIENASYMLPYLIPHTYGVVAGIVEGADRAQELMNDSYSVDEDGTIRLTGKRDSDEAAWLKGVARGVVAPLIERVGGEVGGKILGSLAKNTLGRIPLFSKVGNKIVQSKVGAAVDKWVRSMSRLGKYTGMQSMPVEMLEEFEDQVLDAGLGISQRESEKDGGFFSRSGKAAKEFFKVENLKELAESMFILQLLGGGASYANDRIVNKNIDNFIVTTTGLTPDDISGYSLDEKIDAVKAFVENMSEEEIAEKFNRGAEAINKLSKAMAEGKEWLDDFKESAMQMMDDTQAIPAQPIDQSQRIKKSDLLTAKEAKEQRKQAREQRKLKKAQNEVLEQPEQTQPVTPLEEEVPTEVDEEAVSVQPIIEAPTSASTKGDINTPLASAESAEGGSRAADATATASHTGTPISTEDKESIENRWDYHSEPERPRIFDLNKARKELGLRELDHNGDRKELVEELKNELNDLLQKEEKNKLSRLLNKRRTYRAKIMAIEEWLNENDVDILPLDELNQETKTETSEENIVSPKQEKANEIGTNEASAQSEQETQLPPSAGEAAGSVEAGEATPEVGGAVVPTEVPVEPPPTTVKESGSNEIKAPDNTVDNPTKTTTNRLKNAAGIDPTAVPTKKTKVDKLLAFPDSLEKYGEMTGRLLRVLDKGGVSPDSPKCKRIKAELARMDEAGWGEVYKAQMDWAGSPKKTRGEQPPRTPVEFAEWKKTRVTATPIDNTTQNNYNNTQITAPQEGLTNEGQQTQKTSAEETQDEFRRLQEASRSLSDEERAAYRSGSKQLGEQELGVPGGRGRRGRSENRSGTLVRAFRGRIKSANGGRSLLESVTLKTKAKENRPAESFKLGYVDGATFRDVFEVARNYLQNGELVALHDTYGDDVKCYLSDDGLCGFAVEADGNLVSVFSLRPGSLGAMKSVIKKAGATHLDAYASKNQDLAKIFAKVLGFKVASSMDYNMDYDHDNIAANHGNPNVVFMVKPQKNQTITSRHFGKDDYETAQYYQKHLTKEISHEDKLRLNRIESALDRLQENKFNLMKSENIKRIVEDIKHLDNSGDDKWYMALGLTNDEKIRTLNDALNKILNKNEIYSLSQKAELDWRRIKWNSKDKEGFLKNLANVYVSNINVYDKAKREGDADLVAELEKRIQKITSEILKLSSEDQEKLNRNISNIETFGITNARTIGFKEDVSLEDELLISEGERNDIENTEGAGGVYVKPTAQKLSEEETEEEETEEEETEEEETESEEEIEEEGEAEDENVSMEQAVETGGLNKKGKDTYFMRLVTSKKGDFIVLVDDLGTEYKRQPKSSLDALAKVSPEYKDMIEKLEQGEDVPVRRSISGETSVDKDIRFSQNKDYQAWLKKQNANDADRMREKYEQESAKIAAGIGRNFIRGMKVKIVDREYIEGEDDNADERQSIDGEQRYLRDPNTQKVVGTWNRKTNELTLFRGANASTLVHELGGHAAYQFAQEQAAQGDKTLLNKMNECIDYALTNPKMKPLIEDIRSRYPEATEEVMRDEIFAALMERNSPILQDLTKTLQGKAWYNRTWQAIKDAFRAMLTKMGFNKADLSGIDKMQPEEFISWLDRTMADGKNLGALAGMDLGDRGDSTRKMQIGEIGTIVSEGMTADRAKAMELAGISRREIWDKTGWWKGRDGMWRFEIPDPTPIKLTQDNIKALRQHIRDKGFVSMRLGNLKGMDDLLWAHPDLENVTFSIVPDKAIDGAEGYYDVVSNRILISRRLLSDLKALNSTLIHEIQHAVQVREGFDTGASFDLDAFKKAKTEEERLAIANNYLNSSGEVEARLTEARRNMTSEQRRAAPPWEMYDVAEDEQILSEGNGGRSELRRKGNYNDMPSAEETRRIRAFDRKHPSIIGAGRILLPKGETAKIYRQMSDKGFAGKERYNDERDFFSAYTHKLNPQTGEVETTVYACEYLGDNIFKPYGRIVEMGSASGEQQDSLYNKIRDEFDNRTRALRNRLGNSAGDLVVDFGESERSRDDNGIVENDGSSNKPASIQSNVGSYSSLSDNNYETASDGGLDSNLRKATTTTAATSFMDDKRSRGEKLEEKLVDSTAPIKSVQKEIDIHARANGKEGVEEVVNADGSTDWRNSTDFVAAKDKENGHLERNIRELKTRYIDPAMEALAKAIRPRQNKADLITDFNLYLQCKHAAARNRKIADDRGDTYTADYSEGMGMVTLPDGRRVGLSENVANQLLAKMRRDYGSKFRYLENAAQSVYAMMAADLDNRYKSGLLSEEEYLHYMDRRQGAMGWDTYIPLKDDLQNTEAEAYKAVSFSPTLKRNEFMKAKGRGENDIADSPFAAAVLQAVQGIRRSSRNVLANVEANLAAKMNGGFVKNGTTDFSKTELTSNDQPVYAEIVSGVDARRTGNDFEFTFADGDKAVASSGASVVANRPDIHLFKRDGKLYAIRYPAGANGRSIAVAKAFSGENMGNWGKGMSWVPRVTHWLSSMRTQYSPEFTVSNMLSDNLEALQALVGRYGLWDGGKAFGKVLQYQWKNRKDLWHYVKTGEARGLVKNAIDAGILTKGGVVSQGIDAETKELTADLDKFIRKQKSLASMNAMDMAKSFGRNVVDYISMANSFAEYSTRIGIASALEKYGVPRKDAIKFARDATVNFNRKGTAMPYINGLYMFANAAVQGAMRSVQSFKDDYSDSPKAGLGKNKHKGELVGMLVVIGVAKAIIDSALGDDDEREKEGGRNARNLSEYDRKHNVGLPIGGGRQIVPLRFRGPYAAIPYLAQTFTRYAMGEIDAGDVGAILASELGAQTTELIGGNGVTNDKGEYDTSLFMQSIAPTLVDPFVQMGTGKDYKGDNRLRKKFDDTMPDSSNGKRNTPGVYKGIAQVLNYITGGNENRIGKFDAAPENIQLLAEFIGGAPLRDINNVVSSAKNAAQWASGGTPEKPLSQTPFVRRFVREYPDVTGRYYDAIEMYERDKAEYKKTIRLEDRRELRKDKPYLSMNNTNLDKMIERVKELTHLERGEVKHGRKWVKPKIERTETRKEKYRKQRLKLQAKVLSVIQKS